VIAGECEAAQSRGGVGSQTIDNTEFKHLIAQPDFANSKQPQSFYPIRSRPPRRGP